MTEADAIFIAKMAYGQRGFCRRTGDKNAGGEWTRITGYQVGYYRRGKAPRRNLLSTVHGNGATPHEAIDAALARTSGTPTGAKLYAAVLLSAPH